MTPTMIQDAAVQNQSLNEAFVVIVLVTFAMAGMCLITYVKNR